MLPTGYPGVGTGVSKMALEDIVKLPVGVNIRLSALKTVLPKIVNVFELPTDKTLCWAHK